jgi:hypothetical protein
MEIVRVIEYRSVCFLPFESPAVCDLSNDILFHLADLIILVRASCYGVSAIGK